MTGESQDQQAAPTPVTPPDLRLRGEHPRVTRLSRKVLIGLGAVSALVVAGALGYALQTQRSGQSGQELLSTQNRPSAAGLTGLPKTYAGLPHQTPALGPPLPGDLGKPILNAGVASNATEPDTEAQRLAQEAEAARVSRLFAQTSQQPQPVVVAGGTQASSQNGTTSTPPVDAGSAQNMQERKIAFALWLEGADAVAKVDAYSDIDIWIDAADGDEDDIFAEVECILSRLSPVDFKFEPKRPHPKIRQRLFHLAGTPEFLIADVCIQSHSRVFWYTKGHPDNAVRLLFDKSGVIEFREADEHQQKMEIQNREAKLKETFPFYQVWTKKALKRGDFLEGFSYYEEMVLRPLIELIRIKYQPLKREFYLKHIKRDLPDDVVRRLEPLFKVSSVEDIEGNLRLASQWFDELLAVQSRS